MAVSDVTNSTCDDKTCKDLPKSREKKEKPLTKVIVRRLPPSIDLESFLMQVSPIPDYDYIYIVKGDMSLGEHAFGRVYINFVHPSDIFMFKEKFDNYVFVDQKGHEYPAVVEFASFQKIPRKRKPRPDPKVGTIELDSIYLEFVESLKEQPNQDIKPEFSYQFSENKEISSTPLLDYIKQRRIDKQRIREERREERKRKELERKKIREDERKRYEQKSPAKVVVKPIVSARSTKTSLDSLKEEVPEKTDTKVKEEEISQSEKSVNVKDEQKSHFKPKPRFPTRSEKLDYYDKRPEYKNRRDDYREKEFRGRRFEEYKNEQDFKAPRRTKKYSEKREERRNEARRAELKVMEEIVEKSETDQPTEDQTKCESTELKNEEVASLSADNVEESGSTEGSTHVEIKLDHQSSTEIDEDGVNIGKEEKENKNKEHDPRLQRRIRNKDRPTMAIYQPGMLSKRKTVDEDTPIPKE